MHMSKKLVTIAASVAVMVPVGVAQATHDSGKLGAPGQVCKPSHPKADAQKQALAAFKAGEPAPSKEQVREFRADQREVYKGCIKGAADARSHEESEGETQTQQENGENNSEGAPGQQCKELQRARRDQRRAFNRQDPKPTKAERKAFRQTQNAAYKGCIKAAAEARSDNDQEETPTTA
jgi:hypothetical protein